jgi:hypothetical protein
VSRIGKLADRLGAEARKVLKTHPDLQATIVITDGRDVVVRQTIQEAQRVDWGAVGSVLSGTATAIKERWRGRVTPDLPPPLPEPVFSAEPEAQPDVERGPTPISKGWREAL